MAVDTIAQFEGFRQQAYTCPAGVLTIGYGRTESLDGRGKVKVGEISTQEVEKGWLTKRVRADLDWLVSTGLPECEYKVKQWAALLSLIYNIGRGNFSASSLRRGLLAKAGDISLLASWRAWNKAKGSILRGLVVRREAETKMFFGL